MKNKKNKKNNKKQIKNKKTKKNQKKNTKTNKHLTLSIPPPPKASTWLQLGAELLKMWQLRDDVSLARPWPSVVPQ